VWRTLERFEILHRISPLIRDDLVQFGTDSILSVFLEALELSVCCIGELPVPLFDQRRCKTRQTSRDNVRP